MQDVVDPNGYGYTMGKLWIPKCGIAQQRNGTEGTARLRVNRLHEATSTSEGELHTKVREST